MRIDLYTSAVSQISSEPTSQKVNAEKLANSSSLDGEDHATLSVDLTSIGSLVGTALNLPEIRQDRVDSLRQDISTGHYQLDPAQIAGSIIDDQA